MDKRRLLRAATALSAILVCAAKAAGAGETADAVVLEAGSDWIPLPPEPWIDPGSALDFSSVVPHHKPAGRFGRVISVGNHFEFENLPGVPQRFCGGNIAHSANVPSSAESPERFAANLARLGYNSVRIHHHERWLLDKDGNTSNAADDTVPNPECLDRFDALVAACIRHGLYITTDLYVSRPVPWRSIGIDEDGFVSQDGFKLHCAFWEPACSNLCAWSRNFLAHVNPYTGRSLAEEPALCGIALVNEGNLGVYGVRKLQETRGVPEAWKKWCSEHDVDTTGFPEKGDDPELARFLADAEMRFANRMRAFLNGELGCMAPLSSMNRGYNPVQYQLVRKKCFDYVDAHFYVDHPKFIGPSPWGVPSRCDNRNPVRSLSLGVPEVVFRRLIDKPFCVTEWNYVSPGRYRGMGGVVIGAIGALQDWSGMWRYAWSSHRDCVDRPETRAMYYWDMCSDPLSQAAERAALCLFLRGDLEPLATECQAILDEAGLLDPKGGAPDCAAQWNAAAWLARLGTKVEASPPQTETEKGILRFRLDSPAAEVLAELAARGADKTGGAVSINPATGTILVDTPRTSGGFAESGDNSAGSLRFKIVSTPATIWSSSLDGKPLASSSRILVTHLTDVQNSGASFRDSERSILLGWGRLPHLVLRGVAEIELKLDVGPGKELSPVTGQSSFHRGVPKVFALSPSGRRRAEIPAAFDPATGTLRFTADVAADPKNATYLYEIARNTP